MLNVRSPGFSPARQHPATSTNKCQEKDNTSAITHSRSGAERSDKQRTNEEEETHRLRSAVAFSMHTLCARGTMKPEINAAVGFLSRFLRVKGHVNDRQVQTFNQSLQDILAEQYKHHWFPDRPCKGSGYRCIRINHKMDPLVGQAGQRIGLTIQQLYMLLPSELTLWVDPFEVSYRIGEDGSICVLYESQPCPPGTVAMVPPSGNPSGNSGPMGPMVDSHISCKEELMVLGRTSPSKSYNMMTVSS